MPGQRKYSLGKATEAMDLDLPSGNTCLVIRPGVQGLIKHGILDSLDSLTGLVQAELIDAKDPMKVRKAVSAFAARPDDILAAMDMMDKVIEYVVREPSVLRPIQRDPASGKPILVDGKEVSLPDSERDSEQLYTDEVDTDDKLFIFQFVVGGTRDIESFRAQSAAMLGGVPTVKNVPLPTE